jgi:Protein of unknown function (DUF669)
MSAFNNFANQFENEWGNIEIEEKQYDEVPDGKYVVFVDRCELKETKNGDPMLFWQFEIMEGPHRGRKLFKNNVLKTVDNLRFLKQDLARAGFELERLADLEHQLESLLDRILEVQKKTTKSKGETYENIYINRFKGFAEHDDGPLDINEDDLPF